MAFKFTWQFVCIFPLAMNALFVVSGTAMLIYGIAERLVFQEDSNFASTQNATTDGSLSMTIGCVDIFIGLFGIVTTLTDLRYLLYVYAGLLAASIIGYVVFIIAYGISVHIDMNETKEALMSNVRRDYGKNSEPWSQSMSKLLDTFQREASCCGWSGIDGKNIYVESPWYKENNVNQPGRNRTLPDSCCLQHSEECMYADNVQKARDNGFVHKKDCMDVAIRNYKSDMWMIIVEVLISCTMQTIAVTFSVLQILKPAE